MTELPADRVGLLCCPRTRSGLVQQGDRLVTPDSRLAYPIVSGIPYLVPPHLTSPHSDLFEWVEDNDRILHNTPVITESHLRNFVDETIVPVCGNLFRGVRLGGSFPIPEFPNQPFDEPLVDLGCGWGRWSVAACLLGHRVVAVDLNLEALLCMQKIAATFCPSNRPFLVCADARALPLRDEAMGGVFSYSMLQHHTRENLTRMLAEIARVTRSDAMSFVQMPNAAGIRSFVNARLGSAGERTFAVRYHGIAELLEIFEKSIGPSGWEVDCFLGLNVHSEDRELVPARRRWIIDLADALKRLSAKRPWLARHADSVFIRSAKSVPPPTRS